MSDNFDHRVNIVKQMFQVTTDPALYETTPTKQREFKKNAMQIRFKLGYLLHGCLNRQVNK